MKEACPKQMTQHEIDVGFLARLMALHELEEISDYALHYMTGYIGIRQPGDPAKVIIREAADQAQAHFEIMEDDPERPQ